MIFYHLSTYRTLLFLLATLEKEILGDMAKLSKFKLQKTDQDRTYVNRKWNKNNKNKEVNVSPGPKEQLFNQ